jgi:hypothetical protein
MEAELVQDDVEVTPSEKALAQRRRLRSDFTFYAPTCLKIIPKPDSSGARLPIPFTFNAAQQYIHDKIEEQRAAQGWVRALILKGRQQGVSTYVEARFYHKTSNRRGQKTFILTHQQQATDNLFTMVENYHKNTPPFVRPHLGKSNAKELEFDLLSSSYQVATAGSKGAGRSATLTNVHGSEVAFWENGETHLSGMLQAVPLAPETEVVLESTANGVGGIFHKYWVAAEKGQGDFIAIFVPWYWQPEYTRSLPPDFAIETDAESVPDGELTEQEYKDAYRLNDGQMYWRRQKIIELGGGDEGFYLFKQEYPATADEAFQAAQAGNSLIKRRYVVKARKSNVTSDTALVIGVDPGGEGEGGDPTSIFRRRGRRAYNPQQFTKLNTMQIVALLYRIIKTEKPARMFIDVGGLGAGIFDRLMELEGTQGIVIAVNFGEAALDPTRYKNRRAEMHWLLKDWLEEPGGANIPDDDNVAADLMASIIAPAGSDQLRLLRSKEWMRSKGIRSPNHADALALTFALPINVDYAQNTSSATDFDPISFAVGGGGIGSSWVDFDP